WWARFSVYGLLVCALLLPARISFLPIGVVGLVPRAYARRLPNAPGPGAGDAAPPGFVGSGLRPLPAANVGVAPPAPGPGVFGNRRARLVAEDIDMRFGGIAALAGVRMTIEPASVHGLIEPNGAGNTTL